MSLYSPITRRRDKENSCSMRVTCRHFLDFNILEFPKETKIYGNVSGRGGGSQLLGSLWAWRMAMRNTLWEEFSVMCSCSGCDLNHKLLDSNWVASCLGLVIPIVRYHLL